jgi:hypothetical protein
LGALVLAAACGGSGGGSTSEAPRSKSEYAAQANTICAEVLGRSPPFPTNFSDLSAVAYFFDEAVPLIEELFRKLRELTPPPELVNTTEERFAFAEEQFALSREARDTARRGDRQVQRADRGSRRPGGKGGAPPQRAWLDGVQLTLARPDPPHDCAAQSRGALAGEPPLRPLGVWCGAPGDEGARGRASGASSSLLAFVWKPPSSASSPGLSRSRCSCPVVDRSSLSLGSPAAQAGGTIKPHARFRVRRHLG